MSHTLLNSLVDSTIPNLSVALYTHIIIAVKKLNAYFDFNSTPLYEFNNAFKDGWHVSMQLHLTILLLLYSVCVCRFSFSLPHRTMTIWFHQSSHHRSVFFPLLFFFFFPLVSNLWKCEMCVPADRSRCVL